MNLHDIEKKRLYYRIYQRNRRGGLKKHEYILDDGTRYMNKYPLEKKKSEKILCSYCNFLIHQGNLKRHENSIFHIYCKAKKDGILDNV